MTEQLLHNPLNLRDGESESREKIIDKAHAMALAGDKWRTHAAIGRQSMAAIDEYMAGFESDPDVPDETLIEIDEIDAYFRERSRQSFDPRAIMGVAIQGFIQPARRENGQFHTTDMRSTVEVGDLREAQLTARDLIKRRGGWLDANIPEAEEAAERYEAEAAEAYDNPTLARDSNQDTAKRTSLRDRFLRRR